MVIGVCRIELFIPQAQSLKDKRQVVKSIVKKIGHRFNVSVSEVGHHDLWQRGTIGVAHVANSRTDVEKLLNRVTAFVQNSHDGEVLRTAITYHNPEND